MPIGKTDEVEYLTTSLLRSKLYITAGKFILVYRNTERKIFTEIHYFELIKNGETLFLHFAEGSNATVEKHSIDLSFVDNINGVPLL